MNACHVHRTSSKYVKQTFRWWHDKSTFIQQMMFFKCRCLLWQVSSWSQTMGILCIKWIFTITVWYWRVLLQIKTGSNYSSQSVLVSFHSSFNFRFSIKKRIFMNNYMLSCSFFITGIKKKHRQIPKKGKKQPRPSKVDPMWILWMLRSIPKHTVTDQ